MRDRICFLLSSPSKDYRFVIFDQSYRKFRLLLKLSRLAFLEQDPAVAGGLGELQQI
jgi:hypothetical protein